MNGVVFVRNPIDENKACSK